MSNKLGFILPGNLRGRSIHINVIPTVCNLKNMIEKLIKVNGDISLLKQWEKRSFTAYQLDKIKLEVMSATTKENRIHLIKQHILHGDPNDFGASCIDIYLVAYVAENYKPGKQAFFDYVLKNGISDKLNTAQAIWQVGKGDGTYLGVLNEDGTIREWNFFEQWVKGPDHSTKLENKRTKFGKLVRDRIPEIIVSTGKDFTIKQLTNEEYIHELQKKAFEELNEYVNTKNKEEAGEELADLMEIIHSLAEYHGYSFDEIEEIRKRKAEARGGFKDRFYLIDVES